MELRSALLPFVLLWLAFHAALLAVFLGVRLVGAKMAMLGLLMGGAVWLLIRRPARPRMV